MYECVLQADQLRGEIAAMKELIANKDSETPENIRTKLNELQQNAMKLFEMSYKKKVGMLILCQ